MNDYNYDDFYVEEVPVMEGEDISVEITVAYDRKKYKIEYPKLSSAEKSAAKNKTKDFKKLMEYFLVKEDEKPGIDWVFDIHDYKHRYPACWRCKEELVWKVTDEWYIAMDKGKPSLRERMKRVAQQINWIPEFG